MDKYIVLTGEYKVEDGKKIFLEQFASANDFKQVISASLKSGKVMDIYKKINWTPKEI